MAAMSQRAYAQHRGCSHTAVQRAIQTGRITTLPDGRIDPAVADREWDANTRYISSNASQLAQARTVLETYRARLAKLDYEERVRKLLPADEVRIVAFNTYRRYRDAMLNIPDRVVGAITAEIRQAAPAAALDLASVHAILVAEIRTALTDFAGESQTTSVSPQPTTKEQSHDE